MFRLRRRHPLSIALAFSVLGGLSGGCSSSPEEPILNQFFRSARLGDRTALGSISVATFDDSVSTFEITNVSPETRVALTLKDLAKAHEDARAEDAEFTKRKVAYQDENMEAIRRVLNAERSNAKLTAKDAAVQAEWNKYRDETAQYTKRVSDARRALATQSSVVELSLDDPRTKVDFTQHEGELVSKDVTVDASVRQADGQSVPKTLVVTMQRAVIKANPEVTGKWIITSVRDSAASTATPTS
jgi:hypothetical protein